MEYLVFVYDWNGRDLRKIFIALLKSWLVDDIKRINYVKSFSLNGNQIEKKDQKFVIIATKDEDKLMKFVWRFPQMYKICVK